MKYPDIDQMYRTIPLDKIPWNSEVPPRTLVNLVESGRIRPCKAVDLGCGTGNYSVWLASKGFDVTGVDSSPKAIEIAAENALRKGVSCRFVVADLLGDLREISETFDFAFDYELLHHIYPEDRNHYIQNVYRILNPGSTYLSVCFSEEDSQFGGTGKFRSTGIGTVLYFSSEIEIKNLLLPHFSVQEIRTIEISGKSGPHRAVYALAVRQ